VYKGAKLEGEVKETRDYLYEDGGGGGKSLGKETSRSAESTVFSESRSSANFEPGEGEVGDRGAMG